MKRAVLFIVFLVGLCTFSAAFAAGGSPVPSREAFLASLKGPAPSAASTRRGRARQTKSYCSVQLHCDVGGVVLSCSSGNGDCQAGGTWVSCDGNQQNCPVCYRRVTCCDNEVLECFGYSYCDSDSEWVECDGGHYQCSTPWWRCPA